MKSGSTPLPVCRNSVLFDNSLNDKRFRIDIRMENGYEEGCTRGANNYRDLGDSLESLFYFISKLLLLCCPFRSPLRRNSARSIVRSPYKKDPLVFHDDMLSYR